MRPIAIAWALLLSVAACGGKEDMSQPPQPCAMWPVTIAAGVNDKIDVSLSGETCAAAIAPGTYLDPASLATAVRTALAAASKPLVELGSASPGPAASRSVDAATWSAAGITGLPAGNWYAVIWSGTQFVAVGVNICATSPDGLTWTPRSIPAGTYRKVAWNGSVFVAVGLAGACATSPDGITWTAQSIRVKDHTSVAWNGSVFVAVGTDAFETSPDGVTWTSRTGPTSALVDVAWVGSRFVAVGGSFCATSPDGITWTTQTIPAAPYRALAWNGTTLVAVGGSGCATSPDAGTTWTAQTLPAGFFMGICWTGALFLASSTDGTVPTSPDGVTWTTHASSENNYTAIAAGGADWTVSVDTTGRVTVSSAGAFSLLFATGANAATSARDVLGFGAIDTASGTTAIAPYQMRNTWFPETCVVDDTGELPNYVRTQEFALDGAAMQLHHGAQYARTIDFANLPPEKMFKAQEGANLNEAVERLFESGWSRLRWFPDATDLSTGTDYVLDLDTAKALPRKRLSPSAALYSLSLKLWKYVA